MPTPMIVNPSGVDTASVIKKLTALKREPIKQIEKELKLLEAQNQALGELRKMTKELQSKLKSFYDFDSPFGRKGFIALPEGYVQGIANRKAEKGEHSLEIVRLAQKLRFSSSELDSAVKIQGGKIIIGKKKAQFPGGSPERLLAFLRKNFGEQLNFQKVRPKKGKILIVGETKATGIKGIPVIQDPDSVLRNIGLVAKKKTTPDDIQPDAQNQNQKQEPQEKEAKILFDPLRMKKITGEKWELSADRNKLGVPADSSVRLSLELSLPPKSQLKALSLRVSRDATEDGEKDEAPSVVKDGPEDKLNIKGIELHSYNITRRRKKEEKAQLPPDYGVILKYKDGSEKKVSLKASEGNAMIPLQQIPQNIDFYAIASKARFEGAKIVYALPPEKLTEAKDSDKDLEAIEKKQKELFPNLIQTASDARLKLDGIALSRNRNDDLKDIIDGVTLTLVQRTPNPIQVAVQDDNEPAVKQVEDFIKTYNDLLELAHMVSKNAASGEDASKFQEAGHYKEMKDNSGLLLNNIAVRSLVEGLKRRTSSAYPALRKPWIKILPMVGIHTGKIGASWKDIGEKYGKLYFDKEKFIEMMNAHPEAVKELFVSDTNGDNRADNGFAWVTEHFLRPYVQFTRGILSEQVKNNKESADRLKKQKASVEEHASAYEKKLRQKFSYMESAVQKHKATGSFIKSRMGNGSK